MSFRSGRFLAGFRPYSLPKQGLKSRRWNCTSGLRSRGRHSRAHSRPTHAIDNQPRGEISPKSCASPEWRPNWRRAMYVPGFFRSLHLGPLLKLERTRFRIHGMRETSGGEFRQQFPWRGGRERSRRGIKVARERRRRRRGAGEGGGGGGWQARWGCPLMSVLVRTLRTGETTSLLSPVWCSSEPQPTTSYQPDRARALTPALGLFYGRAFIVFGKGSNISLNYRGRRLLYPSGLFFTSCCENEKRWFIREGQVAEFTAFSNYKCYIITDNGKSWSTT